MSPSDCSTPLSPGELGDYWIGDLPSEKENRIEEHLLACDACSRNLEEISRLTKGIRYLVRKGALRGIVTGSFVDRLAREGLRVREYRLGPGERVACTVTREDDLLVGRLSVDLTGLERVDFVVCDAQGEERERWEDIPVSSSMREVIFTERMDTLRALPSTIQLVKLVARGDEGERLLGEYTFVHTPSP